MKILVLSDSHSGMSFMRYSIDRIKPDHIVHLGDHYDDAKAIAEQYPHIRVHQVPGNCDQFCRDPWAVETLNYDIGGVRFYMSHGHLHGVKSGNFRFVDAAAEAGAAVALYGHTHEAECFRTLEGLWVMNPGSCRSYGGSVGLICIENKEISSCRILRQEDIENLA